MVNKKFHFVYETTNLVNGKYYIGKHSTNDLNDGYLGSGKHFKNAVLKYGKENFSRKILHFFETSEQAWKFEEKIVTEETIKDNNSYNEAYGGKNHIRSLKNNDLNKFKKHQSKAGKKGIVALNDILSEEEKTAIRKKAGKISSEINKNKNHPFYTGEAAKKGGSSHKNKVELWNPNSNATNKCDKRYIKGDCIRVFVNSEKYFELVKKGWKSSKEHYIEVTNKRKAWDC